MSRSTFWPVLLTLFLLPLLLVGRAARTAVPDGPVSSEFSRGMDGWEAADGTAIASWDASGHLAADSEPHRTWYWSTPGKFLGDRSRALGGTLLFELRDSLRRGRREIGPAIVLEGGGLRLGHWRPHEERGETWDLYSADLAPGSWEDLETGRRVGEVDLRRVLSGLERLLIRGIRLRGATCR